MPEQKVFSLLQLCTSVQRRMDEATHGLAYWVRAEIAGIDDRKHVYLELVQHQDGKRVAVMRGIIWQPRMRDIRAALGDELPNILKEGAEIMFQARVRYSPLHGLALHIEGVDLAYSLGEMERRKKATIDTLRAEGLFDRNRSLPEPMVVQRIALVTSVGSAAHADFMRHLENNEYGYRFHVQVFAAAVQGEAAPAGLRKAISALDPALFDAVVLVRGGGSKLDLEAFNDLGLCRLVADLPIPVMTGIGHDVDVSVVDLIAKSPHKTPTAVADHLVDKCLYFETGLNGFLVGMQRAVSGSFGLRKERMSAHAELLRQRPRAYCQERRAVLHGTAGRFVRTTTGMVREASLGIAQHARSLSMLPLRRISHVEGPRLLDIRSTLERTARQGLHELTHRIEGMHDAIRLLDPSRVLARGFSITRLNGEPISDASVLRPGETLETTFAKGRARSIIDTIEPHG